MGRPPKFSPETKTRIVLAVISGEVSVAEAARKEKVSEQSIGRWKTEFLEAGKTALAVGRSGPSTREEQLEAQVEDLTQALGEAAVDLRVWKKSAESRLGPSRTSRQSGSNPGRKTARFCQMLDIPEGLHLKANYQRERRQLARQRKAAFAATPTGPNQVWQFDFSEYETTGGGTWRVAGIADYYSKYEFGWHWSPTANQHDAIAALELALAEAERLLAGPRLVDYLTDPDTGEVVPITLVTDNGGPFRSFRFGAFIASRPELRHGRTRVKTPGQNGVRERAFGSLKYERLYREHIDDALDLVREADAFRVELNTVRPHEALTWNRPAEVHSGRDDPTIPTFPEAEILPTT